MTRRPVRQRSARPSATGRGRVPLERALSKLGLASRTQARAMILKGEVSIGGRVCVNPLQLVVPETAEIAIAGQVTARARPMTILLHKPRGVVTTRSDEKGRATVYSCLEGLDAHLIPVGRLDAATTGLLLLTNDTRLSAWLTEPRNGVPRVYLATVRGEVAEAAARRMMEGLDDEGERLRADRVSVRKASGRESLLVIELATGKNREVRRLCKSVGHEVTRLKRVAFGGLELGELEAGQWRELSIKELQRAFPGAPIRSE